MTIEKINSAIGELTLVADQGCLTEIYFEGTQPPQKKYFQDSEVEDRLVIDEAKKQLKLYFEGKITKFDLKLKPQGTPFQLQAWEALQEIPYGKTVSYGGQALRLGDKNKARAVGRANGLNPLPIVIPCHRVIGHSGHLVGFGGGLKIKSFLLNLESQRANL